MSKRVVNIGSAPNDGTGDSLRDGMDKINQNFNEIYDNFGDGTSLDISSIGDASTLDGENGSYYLDYNNFTNTPSDLSEFNNSVGFVTSGVVVGYATESYVIDSLVGYATETYVDLGLASKADLTGANFTGVVTAIQFVGDGSGLSGVTAVGTGVEIEDNGSFVGTAATINFGTNSIVTVSDGIATVNVQVPQVYFDSNNTGIHTLSNVGIGTTNAESKLTVSGDVKITGVTTITGNYFYVGNPDVTSNLTSGVILDNSGKITHQSSGGETHIVGYSGTSLSYALSKDGNLYLGGGNPDDGGSGGNISILGQSSKIGIGSTLPQVSLDVSGDARITGILTVGSSSITLDGQNNTIEVGSGVTIYGNSGIVSATTFYGDASNLSGVVTSITLVGYATESYVDNLVSISTFSGNYNDLFNQPTIPSDTSDLTNSAGFITGISTFTGAATTITSSQISNWDISYSWGDHAVVGYATDASINSLQSQINALGANLNIVGFYDATVGVITSLTVVGETRGYISVGSTLPSVGITTGDYFIVSTGGTDVGAANFISVGIVSAYPGDWIVGVGNSEWDIISYSQQVIAPRATNADFADTLQSDSSVNTTGIITANSFYGNGINLTGVVTSLVGYATEGYVDNSVVGFITSGYLVGYATEGYVDNSITVKADLTGANFTGVVTATSFSGSGSGLTNLPAGQLTGSLPAIDGSALINVVGSGSGIVIKDSEFTVGTAGTINFGDNLSVTEISAGIVTVIAAVEGGTQWVSTAAGIHTLSNVGIGTTNSTEKLTVRGNVSLGDNDKILLGNDGDFEIYSDASGNTIFKNSTSNTGGDIYIQSDSILIKKYDGSQTIAEFTEGAGVELNYNGQNRLATVSTGVIVGSNFAGVAHIPTELRIGSISSNQSDATILIANSSGVGIATTNPTSKLTVSGDANISGVVTASAFVGDGSGLTGVNAVGTGISVFDSGSSIGVATAINFGNNLSVSAVSVGLVTVTATAGGGGESYWVSTASGIHTTSNVGIGSTIPTSALTVTGSGTSTSQLYVTGVSTFTGSVSCSGNVTANGVSATSLSATTGNITATSGNIYLSTTNREVGWTTGNGIIRTTGVGSSLSIKGGNPGENMGVFTEGSSVELYYDGIKKFETIGTGVTVTGDTFTNQLSVSGVVTASSFSGSASGLTNIPSGQLTGALPAIDGSALLNVGPLRTVVTGVTTSISNNGIGNTNITGFKSYALMKVGLSTAGWLRLYTDSASRDNDVSRSVGIDPSPGSGVIAEVITTGITTTQIISPFVMGGNLDNPADTIIYAAITNLSGSTQAITANLTILQLEA